MGDAVFVGSCSGVAYSLDRSSGEVTWSYDTRQDAGPAQFHGDPVVIGGQIVTGSDTAEPSFSYSFDKKTGELNWKVEGHVIETDVLSVGGVLSGRTRTGALIGIEPATGTKLWAVEAEGRTCGERSYSPAARGRTVYSPQTDGTLVAVDATSGAVRWKSTVGCASTAVAMDGNALFLGVSPDRLIRLDPNTGGILSERELNGRVRDRLTLLHDQLVALVDGHRVVAFDRDLKQTLWTLEHGSEITSPRPLLWRETILIGDRSGQLLAIAPERGDVVWSLEVDGIIRGLGSGGSNLYVGTLEGVLHALRLD